MALRTLFGIAHDPTPVMALSLPRSRTNQSMDLDGNVLDPVSGIFGV
jgi:hypothetical protein